MLSLKISLFIALHHRHAYKLCKARYCNTIEFFSQKIVNMWIFLPRTVHFSFLVSFRRTIESVDFTDFPKCSFD